VLEPPLRLPTTGIARLLTAGLLPPRLREAFGLPWDAAHEARLAALCTSARALRGAGPGTLDARSRAR
jgi:uncharacterized protein (DUF2236 family)